MSDVGGYCGYCGSGMHGSYTCPERPSDIHHLVPKGLLGTPRTVIADLVARADTMEEIYVIVKDKDGTSKEYVAGNMAGLCFAIMLLQNYAFKALADQ